jgi:Ca-activated chloride channel family protein
VKLRYKQPDGETSTLIERPVQRTEIVKVIGQTSEHYRFAAAVAGLGQILRGGKYTGEFSYPEILALARGARGDDPFGYRGEFLQLANLASSL